MTSEREEVLHEFGTAECVKRDDCTHFDCVAERKMAEEIVRLRSQLAAVREELCTSQEHEALADRDFKEMRRERDEARREREVEKQTLRGYIDGSRRAVKSMTTNAHTWLDNLNAEKHDDLDVRFASALSFVEALRHRAERAEAEAAYIRRAFRGAVESDALAVTYKTVGSYRAGLLKTINALDTAEAP